MSLFCPVRLIFFSKSSALCTYFRLFIRDSRLYFSWLHIKIYSRHENLYFFRDPDFIVYFEHLETLILDHNRINENVVFPRITTLTTLWMNFNLIGNLLPFADNLAQSFPKLNYLSMMGNPAAPSFINYGKFHDYVVYR